MQLEQAFLNLILNAVEAMPGGGRLTVSARAVAPGRVRVQFHDTGAGLDAERQRRAFAGLLGSTKPHGTGLGLAIVRRVVETHQGAVRLRSRPGRGTTIALTLPAAARAEASG